MKIYRLSTVSMLVLALAASAFPAFAADAPQAKVNINTATAEQLAFLPRVGPSLAERIVAHRDENGPFAAPGDLVLVRGIGEKSFAAMEPYVTVKGETTLDAKVRLPRPAAAAAETGDER